MTKADFNRAKKYLKGKLPDYHRFKLCKTIKQFQSAYKTKLKEIGVNIKN